MFKGAVTITIDEAPDAASGFGGGIIAHLGDVHGSVSVPGDGDGAIDVRLRDDEFDGEVGICESNAFQGFGG